MPRQRGLVDTAASTIVSAVVSTAASSLLQPASRALGYVANFVASNVVPDPASLLQLWNSNRLGGGDLYRLMGCHGIQLDPAANFAGLDRSDRAWADILDLSRPTFDVQRWVDLWHSGLANEAEVDRQGERAGLLADHVRILKSDWQPPDMGTAVDWRNRGIIDNAQLQQYATRHGLKQGTDQNGYREMFRSVGPETAVMAHYIGAEPPQGFRNQVAFAGYGDDATIDWFRDAPKPLSVPDMMNMYFRGYMTQEQCYDNIKAVQTRGGTGTASYFLSQRPMPGPSDLVRFAVREVWDNATVARWGYDQEFPAEFQVYMERQGMGWGDHPADWPFPAQAGIKWPQAYWRAHWQPFPVHVAHVAYHMLRPERIARYQQIVPDITPFTYDDLRTALKVADYPPGVRQWLAATSFTPMRLSQVRQAYENQIANRAEAVELMRDRGLVPADAEAVIATWDHQAWLKDRRTGFEMADKAKRENLKHILTAFDTGLVDRARARTLLEEQFVPPEVVDMVLNNVIAKNQWKRFGLYLKKVKEGYMEGTYSSVQVRQYLDLLGVVPNRAAGYLQDWDLERTVSHKAASTAMILKYVREGLLSPTDGKVRLVNLGWINVDASLAIASAQAALARTQSRVLAAADRERARRARELQKIQEDLKKERKRIASQIRQETPLSTLKTWYVNCYIGRKYLVPRLEAMLYTADDIKRYLHEWDDLREKKGNADCKPHDEESGSNGSPPKPGVP